MALHDNACLKYKRDCRGYFVSRKRWGAWDAPRNVAPMLRKSPTGNEEVFKELIGIKHANQVYSLKPVSYYIQMNFVNLCIAPFWH